MLQQAQREVRTAWVDLESTTRTIDDYQQRMVELANENADLAERAFAAGTTDLTVLLEAQRRQTSTRVRLNDLRARAARQFYELERAAGGTLDPDTIAALEAQQLHASDDEAQKERSSS
jgi:outer membrane protein TolC